MKLLTDEQRATTLANGKANAILRDNGLDEQEFSSAVKLFCPWAQERGC
jgi:hypothetical protein